MTAFTLDTTPGARRLTIAGQDVTDHTAGCTLVVTGNAEPAVLHVEIQSAESLVEGDGVVHFYHPPTDDQIIEQARALLASLPVEQVRALTEARFTSMSQDMVSLTIETIADMLGGS